MLNAFYLDSQQRQLLDTQLKTQDKTIIWFYAPGYFDETGSGLERDRAGNGPPDRGRSEHPRKGECRVAGRAGRVRGRSAAAGRRPVFRRGSAGTALAVRSDDPLKIVVAQRPMDKWTSIYSATAPLTAPLLKQLAAEAGVHIYDPDPTHLLYANRRFLTVCANNQGGPAAIRLPRQATVIDLASGETAGQDVDEFTVELRPKEVRMFLLR